MPATSSAVPWRLIAMKLCIKSFMGPSAGLASVSIGPGCTILMVMPRGPKSRASPRAIPCNADLLKAYEAMPGSGMRSPLTEPITMMRPPAGICRAASTAAW